MLNITPHNHDASIKVPYEAQELGAPFKVYLTDGVYTEIDQDTGKLLTCIEDAAGLLAAVIRHRVLFPRKLSGADLKFIRSALCMKSKEVAGVLDVSVEHYSRLENNRDVMSSHAEKWYRMFVFLRMGQRDLRLAHLASKLPQAERTKQKAEEALEDIRQIFFGIKIVAVFDPDDELTFTFHRGCVSLEQPCDDEKWHKSAA